MEELDTTRLHYYAAVDFAISNKERSDYTVIAVVGVDDMNRWYVVDVRRGRWDSKEIIDLMFAMQIKWKPELFTLEGGMIQKSIVRS